MLFDLKSSTQDSDSERTGEGDGADRDDVEDQSGEVGSDSDNQMLGEFEGPSLVEQVGVEADQISEEDVVYY